MKLAAVRRRLATLEGGIVADHKIDLAIESELQKLSASTGLPVAEVLAEFMAGEPAGERSLPRQR
jgi:hypothetical protein